MKACGFLLIHACVVGCAPLSATQTPPTPSGDAGEYIELMAAEEKPSILKINGVPRVLELDLSRPLSPEIFSSSGNLDTLARSLTGPMAIPSGEPLRSPSINVTRAYVSGRVALLDGNFAEAIARLEYVVNRGGGSAACLPRT